MNRPWLVDSAVLKPVSFCKDLEALFYLVLENKTLEKYARTVSDRVYLLVGDKQSEKLLHRGESTWQQLTGLTYKSYILGWTVVVENEYIGIEHIQSFYPQRGWNIAELIIALMRNKFNKPVHPLVYGNVSFWAHNSHLLCTRDQARTIYIGDFARDTLMHPFISFETAYSKYVSACNGIALDYNNFRSKYRLEMQQMLASTDNIKETSQIMSILNSEITV